MIFVSFSIENIVIPCSYHAPIVPPNLLQHPLNLIYILLIPWLVLWVNLPYIGL